MAINLEEHKFFEFQRKMDVVPYSIAKKAVEEAYSSVDGKVDEAMKLIQNSLSQLNVTLPELDDQDSARKS